MTVPIDAALADRLVRIFLEVVVAPAVDPDALEILARRPNMRVVLDPGLGAPPVAGLEFRSAGGAILATEADVAADDAGDLDGGHAARANGRRA